MPVPIYSFFFLLPLSLSCTAPLLIFVCRSPPPSLPPSLHPYVPFFLYAAGGRCALVAAANDLFNGHPFRPIPGDVSVQLRELVERDPRLRKGFYAYYRENYAKGKAGKKIMGVSSRSGTAASGASGATGATGGTHSGGGGGRGSRSDSEADGPSKAFPEGSAGVTPVARGSEGPLPVPSWGSTEMLPPVGGTRGAAREPMEEEGGGGDEESPSPSAMREACLSASCPAASRRGKVKAGAGKAVKVSKGGRGRGRDGRGGGGRGGGMRGERQKKKEVEEVTQEGFIDPPDIAGLGKEKICGVCLGPGGGKGSDMFLECRR